MSATSNPDAGEIPDRRVRRTRAAIVSAFNRLILDRGYASLTPGAVAAAADVGRSTFYEHFRGLDDVLALTLGPLLSPLANACFEETLPNAAGQVVEHLWANRRLARALLAGEAHAVVSRCFAALFTAALVRAGRAGDKPLLEPELIALQLAAGQLALLDAWLSGRTAHSAPEISHALHVGGRASVQALTGMHNSSRRNG